MKVANFSCETRAVVAMLQQAGHQALFVGGCVRNALLGAEVADIDIATDALPNRVVQLAGDAGLKAVATGIDHGTVTVVAQHVPYEITTFRRDVETDGRRAVVAYATSHEEDAHRRDFTMNALYARPDGAVIDPLGGLPDLRARRVRFIDDPEQRIREDYLRILRFFRFHAWYGNPGAGLDADGLAACAALADGIDTLSAERLGSEVKKLLAAPQPCPAVAAMAQAGVLARVLPGADARALPLLVHFEEQTRTPPSALRRLAVLGGEDAAGRLRLSRAEARGLAQLRIEISGLKRPGALGYALGEDVARDVLLLRSALTEAPLPEDWQAESAFGANATFPVRAADLMPHLSGPALGAALQQLELAWIDSGFTLGKAELLRKAGG